MIENIPHRVYDSLRTAPRHISCILNRLGTYANESGSMSTASLHISCVLRWSGISLIHIGTISSRDIFYLYHWTQARIKFYGHAKTTFESILRSVDVKKWWWDYWRYTLNYAIYRCSINNEYTPKNGNFFLKKWWNHTLKRSFYRYKTMKTY